MNRLIAVFSVGVLYLLTSQNAIAVPPYQFSSSNLTSGSLPRLGVSMSALTNPAAASYVQGLDESITAFGIIGSIGISAEVGPIDNLAEDLDRLADELDRSDLTLDEANQIIDEFNSILVQMGDSGYVKIGAFAHVPLFPIIISSEILGGNLALDINLQSLTKLNILDDPLTANPISGSLDTNTSLYVKSATVTEFSLAYSRLFKEFTKGKLFAGLKLNMYEMDLSKTVSPLSEVDDVASVLEDDLDRYSSVSTGIGLDLGVIWDTGNWYIGATMLNILEPKFNFGEIGANCDQLEDVDAQTNCFTAISYQTQISLSEKHLLNTGLRIQGAYYLGSSWILGGFYDVATIADPVGDENQFAGLGFEYLGSIIIPSFRVGIRNNLVDDGLGFTNFGITLFKLVNLDFSISNDKVEVDGNSASRAVAFNLGLDFRF
jgi:hypothetical protein